MHLERYGTGPEVYVGLHGWSGDHTTFSALASHLPVYASFLGADLPGCGQSPPPARWTLDTIVDEIAESVASCAPRVTLVGVCSGALLALLTAERLPERVERLVLVDAFAYVPWYFRIFLVRGLGRRAYDATFANPLGRWLTNQSLRGRRTGASDLTSGFGRVDHEATYRYLEMFGSFESAERFCAVRAPIDVVYGAKTFGAVKRSIDTWRELWPAARTWQLDGAGHLALQENPSRLAEIIFEPRSVAARRTEA